VSVPEEGVLLYRRRGDERGNEPGRSHGHRHAPTTARGARVARPSPFTNFTSGPPSVHPLSWL
jgi:hypothetical protein